MTAPADREAPLLQLVLTVGEAYAVSDALRFAAQEIYERNPTGCDLLRALRKRVLEGIARLEKNAAKSG